MVINLPSSIIVPHPDAYLVGGSVRDLIRGAAPLDYDIVVARHPEAYAHALAQRCGSRVILLGRPPFSVYRVNTGATHVDVSLMNGADIATDLRSRDFTINALASALDNGQVIDLAGGLKDLERHIVRMVSPDVFTADPVRMVRAYRMAAAMDFAIEPQTARTIAADAKHIQKSAGERILDELHKIMDCSDSHRQIAEMTGTGLLPAIFPELDALKGCRQNAHHTMDVLQHTLTAYRQSENILNAPDDWLSETSSRFVRHLERRHRIRLKMAILLHDIGKPDTRSTDASGATHFHGHAKQGAALLPPIYRRLRMSANDMDWLSFLVRHHQDPLTLFLSTDGRSRPYPSKAAARFFGKCGHRAPMLLLHALADHAGKVEDTTGRNNGLRHFLADLLKFYFESIQARQANPLINGNDLIQRFGLPPSPRIGSILRKVEAAYLSGEIADRDQALAWVAERLDA